MKPCEIIVRALITTADARDLTCALEPCGQAIWLSRTTRCARHNLVGVSAKQLDVLVQDDLLSDDADGLVLCEVSHKTGKYDGAIRTRIALRRHHTGYECVDDAELVRTTHRETRDDRVVSTTTIAVVRRGDTLWSKTFDLLRAAAVQRGARDLVGWHWSRYFRHLPSEVVEEVTATLVIEDGTTITAANRAASNALYAASVERGWKKLTLRERAKLGFPADAGAWQREDAVAQRRAALAGFGSPTGCGEYTLESALRRVS